MTNKTLIVYYSWSGTTATMAKLLQKITQGDLVELTVQPTTFSKDMMATSEIATHQLETGKLPQLTNDLPELRQYDTLLVGSPVWSGQVATPVRTFLQSTAELPKIVAPFYTDAGTPNAFEADFQQLARQSVHSGLGMTQNQLQQTATATQQLTKWWQQFA